jgi:hypothetical protein
MAASDRLQRRRRENQDYVRRLKQNPCTDCEKTYAHPAMDWDHCRGEKVMDIALMVRRGLSRERLDAELAKCDLVCANCHRIRTWLRDGCPD